MSLRTRLALLMALLTTLTAGVVTFVSLRVTSRRLDNEVTSALEQYAARIGDPDGRVVRLACGLGPPPRPLAIVGSDDTNGTGSATTLAAGARATVPDDGLGRGGGRRGGPRRLDVDPIARGIVVQCLDRNGGVLRAGSTLLDVTAREVALARASSERDASADGPAGATSTLSGAASDGVTHTNGATNTDTAPEDTGASGTGASGTGASSTGATSAGGPSVYALARVSRSSTIGEDRFRVVTVAVEGTTIGAVQLGRSLAENDRVLASLLRRYLLVALGAVLAAAVAGLLLARRITRPIAALTAAAERVAGTGGVDLALPDGVRGHGRDETGRLARSFDAMLASLRTSREQQARLVQDAGHELRTPITSLRANIDTLRRHAELPADRRRRILDDVDAELRELTDLTNELVELAAGAVANGVHGGGAGADDDATAQPFDLAAAVAESVERHRRRNAGPVTLAAPVQLIVHGHPQRLRRVIDNLLGNAVKFGAGGSIEVELTSEPAGGAVLRVRDHGPGIAEADLPRVFERFYRSDAARTLPGSGLGLSIVADTVRAHGGTVVAERADGGGARIVVTLPHR